MEWQDEGVLLARRRHGESAAILEVFTASHGRHAGVVPGGAGRRLAPLLQPGAQLQVTWRGRLEDHIGTFRVEPVRSRVALVLGDPAALAALAATVALLAWAMPEREAHPALYARSVALLDGLGTPGWEADYARWELALLADLGFGLDLARCAATGATADLVWVSPRSGRAVSRAAGSPWADRLLPLPAFLTGGGPAGPGELAAALALTGHFLRGWLAPALERPRLPDARERLAARFGG
jgi:DNA repair protein RecO (recombination protein O)